MDPSAPPHRPAIADAVFELLDPVPYGCFVAALVFDVAYACTAEILWTKAAAWLIVLGLVVAIVPRLIDLWWTWGPSRRRVAAGMRVAFRLNLLAVLAAIANAFVHSRDAYAVVPAGQWLSALTVLLIALARIVLATRRGGLAHG
ncbi:MAG TPA: DUF2231 domain-containing protein [Lysobacter sp.]